MSSRKLVFLFVPMALALGTAPAQDRMVPHLTRPDGNFLSRIIIVNPRQVPDRYSFAGYDEEGALVGEWSERVLSGVTLNLNATELFDDFPPVSHFIIAPTTLRITVVYQADVPGSGPAHVPETDVLSRKWRVFSGNPEVTWDGIAFVNRGQAPASVSVMRFSPQGTASDPVVLHEELAAMAKGLYVFGQDFLLETGTWFDVVSDQPLAVTTLRGDVANSLFLWENGPTALDVVPVEESVILAKGELTIDPPQVGESRLATTTASGQLPEGLSLNAGDRLVFEIVDPDAPLACSKCAALGMSAVDGDFSSTLTLMAPNQARTFHFLSEFTLDPTPNNPGST